MDPNLFVPCYSPPAAHPIPNRSCTCRWPRGRWPLQWVYIRFMLDCKEIQPVHPKGDQSWVFIGRTDAEAETPILWPPHAKSWLIGKDPDTGRDWGQEEKGMTEDEMVGWHHWLDGHEFWVNSGSWWWTGSPGVLRFTGSQSRTRLSNWTEGLSSYKTLLGRKLGSCLTLGMRCGQVEKVSANL